MKSESWLMKFLIWRMKHVSNKNFVLFLGGVIGAIAGLAAVILKQSVHLIQHFLTSDFDINIANYFYLGYPLIGILLTVVVGRFILKTKIGHGMTQILYDISKRSSIVQRGKMYSGMITSAFTVGFGGSVGLEAPIVVTGSAIGSNVGRIMHLNYKKRTLLIGCGTAGAIAGIYNSPIAGVIFALEVILADVTIAMFIPLLIASVSGSLVSMLLLGDASFLSFKLKDPFMAEDVPYFIVLGLFCGVLSVYFTRTSFWVERQLLKIKGYFSKAILGGVLLGLIIFILPPIYGEGYDTLKNLLNEDLDSVLKTSLFFGEMDNILLLLAFLFAIVLMKPVASALTIGSGGNGGVFGPSLFLGGVAGFFFASSMNMLDFGNLSLSNFTLVGMCGIMSGVLHAPLTAIFLIAELTSGYELFVPLMLVSAISYNTSTFFDNHSIYTKHLVESGDLIKYDKDRQVLRLIDLHKIIETDLFTIAPDSTLDNLVDLVRISKRNIFPVVNDAGQLLGVITLDDIREVMFDEEERKETTVRSLMHSPPAQVSSDEDMESVMSKFEMTGAWNLPVIDDDVYIGFLSKSRIFNTYRKKLIRQHRE